MDNPKPARLTIAPPDESPAAVEERRRKWYEENKEAIEAYLINSVKSFARIVTKSKSRDTEQQEKYSEMMRTMIDDYGYSSESAEEVLAYASNHLWRDG